MAAAVGQAWCGQQVSRRGFGQERVVLTSYAVKRPCRDMVVG